MAALHTTRCRLIGALERQARLSTLVPPAANLSSSLHTSCRRQATYRRFGDPVGSKGAGPSGLPSTSSAPMALQELWRRARGGGGGGGGGGPRRKGNRGLTFIYLITGGGVIYVVAHLERVPATGRLRFITVSPSAEKEIGNQTFQRTMQENKGKILPKNDPRVKQVQRVAARIVDALQRSEYSSDHLQSVSMDGNIKVGDGSSRSGDVEWEVFVIQEEQANAFVLPNGKIFVYSGILPICQDEDGLATVLGHEVAHQVARHMAEKISFSYALWAGAFILDSLGFDFGLSNPALTLGLLLPNSRKLEVEADKIGLQLMSMACFDPRKAPSVWKRMGQAEGQDGGLFQTALALLSTHPLSTKRMESMQKWLPDAMETRQRIGCPDSAVFDAFHSATRRPSGM